MSRSVSKADIVALVSLTADRVQVFQPPRDWEEGFGGGRDVDCIVKGLDPAWPLRLSDGWRLCQALRYRHGRWQWWLERAGDVLIIDTTTDPPITLESGISSASLLTGAGVEVAPISRAIYLTRKRLLKRMRDPQEWSLISSLARGDEAAYTHGLAATFGRRLARKIARYGIEGTPPDEELVEHARKIRLLRYALHPLRALAIYTRESSRVVLRLVRPTGLHVLVVGPDGSGKSTVARELLENCGPLFRRRSHVHWRPGILPRPGGVVGRPEPDVSQPHSRHPHRRILAPLFLAYYWLDFFFGGWIRLRAIRARTGLVVQERGWWDIAVDPRRYRLRASRRAVLLLGRLLPKPDLIVVAGSSPETLLARKAELPIDELTRQLSAWEGLAARIGEHVYQDTSEPLENTMRDLRARLTERLEATATARLGAGWTSFGGGRFLIPRGPRAVARAGLAVYQPVTPRGRMAWRASRVLAELGGFRLRRRSHAPSQEVRAVLAEHLPVEASVAFARANHPGRSVALLTTAGGLGRTQKRIDREGHGDRVAKLATDRAGRAALAREAEAISTLGASLSSPLAPPKLVHASEGLLIFEKVDWKVRDKPWYLPEEVAFALGEFYRRAGTDSQRGLGASHGDFAPWNLLVDGTGTWYLLDWEDASDSRPAFWDVLHFLVQSYALLGRPSQHQLLDGLDGRGWVSGALQAYAAGAEGNMEEAVPNLIDYLRKTTEEMDRFSSDGRRGIAARERLLADLGAGYASHDDS